jgi:hypothetical protein
MYDKLFVFMNCHLKSGASKSEKRSDMMGRILSALATPDAYGDFCFVLGDLNYRLKTTYEQHFDKISSSSKMIPQLDELYEEMHRNNRYPGYIEKEIGFDPTYKRDRMSNSNYINKND